MSRFAAHPAASPALSKTATRQAHVCPAHCSKPHLLPQSSTQCVLPHLAMTILSATLSPPQLWGMICMPPRDVPSSVRLSRR